MGAVGIVPAVVPVAVVPAAVPVPEAVDMMDKKSGVGRQAAGYARVVSVTQSRAHNLWLMGSRPREREQRAKARGGRCEHTREGQTLDKRNILRIRWGAKTEGYIHLDKRNTSGKLDFYFLVLFGAFL